MLPALNMVVPRGKEIARFLWVLGEILLVAVQVQVALGLGSQIQEAATLSLLLHDDDIPLMYSRLIIYTYHCIFDDSFGMYIVVF